MPNSQGNDAGRVIFLETHPLEYKIRLAPGWAKKLLEKADKTQNLARPAMALVAELRAITVTASLPFTVVSHIVEFYRSFIQGSRDLEAGRLVRATAARLTAALLDRTDEHQLTSEQKKTIQSEVLRIENEVSFAESVDFSEELGNKFWQKYMDDKGFKHGVWGSQRYAYVSVYNAYDSFLTASIKAEGNLASYRKGTKEGLKKYFSDSVAETCWEEYQINLGRLVRHAISHAEGKQTADLERLSPKHDIVLTDEDKILNVIPKDLKRLLRSLEVASLFLIESKL